MWNGTEIINNKPTQKTDTPTPKLISKILIVTYNEKGLVFNTQQSKMKVDNVSRCLFHFEIWQSLNIVYNIK